MKTIRAGRGLGDSIYLASIVRAFGERGKNLSVFTDFPDVFKFTPGAVHAVPFRRAGCDIVCHYVGGKQTPHTTQFEDMAVAARALLDGAEIPLRLSWRETLPASFQQLIETLPVVLVQMPRPPMNRTDGFGGDVLPDFRAMQRVVSRLAERAQVVQIGGGDALYRFQDLTLDLANKTTVAELIDLAHAADGLVGFPSFVIPLAESFGKPLLAIWSNRGLKNADPFIRSINPRKLIHHPDDAYVVTDNQSPQEIFERVDDFLSRLR